MLKKIHLLSSISIQLVYRAPSLMLVRDSSSHCDILHCCGKLLQGLEQHSAYRHCAVKTTLLSSPLPAKQRLNSLVCIRVLNQLSFIAFSLLLSFPLSFFHSFLLFFLQQILTLSLKLSAFLQIIYLFFSEGSLYFLLGQRDPTSLPMQVL